MGQKEIMERLQAPFKLDEIEFRVGSTNKEKTKGLALAYVTNRAIQNRLDEVFGCFGWKNEYKEWKGNSQLCGISIWLEDRKEWVTKWDGADDSNMDAVKGGLSDSMKRCAYQWGIGRYLYQLPQVWCDISAFGKSYKLNKKPTLPRWALPIEMLEKDIKELFAKANEYNYTEKDIHEIIEKQYSIESVKSLTIEQKNELMQNMKYYPKTDEELKKLKLEAVELLKYVFEVEEEIKKGIKMLTEKDSLKDLTKSATKVLLQKLKKMKKDKTKTFGE